MCFFRIFFDKLSKLSDFGYWQYLGAVDVTILPNNSFGFEDDLKHKRAALSSCFKNTFISVSRNSTPAKQLLPYCMGENYVYV